MKFLESSRQDRDKKVAKERAEAKRWQNVGIGIMVMVAVFTAFVFRERHKLEAAQSKHEQQVSKLKREQIAFTDFRNKIIGSIGNNLGAIQSLLRAGGIVLPMPGRGTYELEFRGAESDPDAGLKCLRGAFTGLNVNLGQLRAMRMSRTHLSDTGLAALAQLADLRLQSLDLSGCEQITDAGIDELAKLNNSNLEELNLAGCRQLGRDGVERLRAALKTTKITGP